MYIRRFAPTDADAVVRVSELATRHHLRRCL